MSVFDEARESVIQAIDEYGIKGELSRGDKVNNIATGGTTITNKSTHDAKGLFKNINSLGSTKSQALSGEYKLKIADKLFLTPDDIKKDDVLTVGIRTFNVLAVIDVTPTDITIINYAIVRAL